MKQFKVTIHGKFIGIIREHKKSKKGVVKEGYLAILATKVARKNPADGDRTLKAHKANTHSALSWLIGVALKHEMFDRTLPITQSAILITPLQDYEQKAGGVARYDFPVEFVVTQSPTGEVAGKAAKPAKK